MRIHLKNVSPKIHGMITEHKASHGHDNLDETVSCLIEEAMRRYIKRQTGMIELCSNCQWDSTCTREPNKCNFIPKSD